MPMSSFLAVIIIGGALLFAFLNGLNDSGAIVATLVATRALTPRQALSMAAVAESCGPFIFGHSVALTIGRGIVFPSVLTGRVVAAAIVGAILWGFMSARWGLPSSSSHALIGGLVGAGLARGGPGVVSKAGLTWVVALLLIAPLAGFVGGYLAFRLILFAAQGATPRVNLHFQRGQIMAAELVALAHGTNDAQKSIGIIVAGLVALGMQSDFRVQPWVVTICAGALALGIFLGGRRTLRTLSGRFYHIRPIHGLAASGSSATTALVATALGAPVSTSQVISMAIVGAGAGERMSRVRWHTVSVVLIAWLLTIPASSVVSMGVYQVSVLLLR